MNMREHHAIRTELLRMKWQLTALLFQRALRRHLLALKAYNPEQPRDDLGRWTSIGGSSAGGVSELGTGDNIQIAGTVIRVCVAGSSARSAVNGVKTYGADMIARVADPLPGMD
jgi:hypothetical protein